MRKLRKAGLLRDSVSLRLQNADIGQIPVVFVVVKAIAHYKGVGNGKADVIGLQGDAGTAALGLIQQGADLQRRRLPRQQMTVGEVQRIAT